MTSKSSFFDILRENLKRRTWTCALSVLFFLFYFPIGTLLSSDMYLKHSETMTAADIIRAKRLIYNSFVSMHESSGMIIVFWLCFIAVIMAFTGFAYLQEQKKTDFYHSLPISRPVLYAVNITNSILTVAVPYFIMAMLSAVIAAAKTGYSDCFAVAASAFVQCFGFYMLMLMTAILSVMLTGTKLVGILGTGIFYFWGPIVVSLIFALMGSYFRTYYDQYYLSEHVMQFTSPLFWSLDSDISINVKVIAAYLLSAALFFINMKLYMMRPSEAAGHAMVYKYTRGPIKAIIVIPSALSCGLVFHSMMDNSDFWTVFAIVCGCIIIHCIIEIIYSLDFKKLFAHKAGLAGCLIVSLAVFAFFRFDLSGFDSYLPDASKVSSAGIYSNAIEDIYSAEDELTLNNDGEYCFISIDSTEKKVIDRMEVKDIASMQSIATEGIEYAAKDLSNVSDFDGKYMDTIIIGWHLNNGKTVYRQYYMDLKAVSDELNAVIDNDDYRRGTYPILAEDESTADDIQGINYQDALGFHHMKFDGAEGDELVKRMSKLYSTYRSELSKLTADDRRHESPVITIQFKDSYIQSMADTLRKQNGGYYGQLNYALYYPVYPSFTKTLALLNEYGVNINAGISADDINTIVISDARGYRTADTGESIMPKADLIVTDKEQIKEILANSRYDLNCSNILYPQSFDIDASAHLARSYAYSDKAAYPDDLAVAGFGGDDGFGVSGNLMTIESEPAADTSAELPESTVYIDEFSSDKETLSSDAVSDYYDPAADMEVNSASADYYDDGMEYEGAIGSIQLYFKADSIPSFVKDYFGIDDTAASVRTW